MLTTNPLDIQIAGDHYRKMKIQPVEFITANELGFLEGCVVKRVCRWRAKDGLKDLHKAIHELQLLIAAEEKKIAEAKEKASLSAVRPDTYIPSEAIRHSNRTITEGK
jgi:hypothetical protein